MISLENLNEASESVKRLKEQYDWSVALKSIDQQIEYLIALAEGADVDRSLLDRINIGVLAAREVEDMDRGVAEQLHAIAAGVREMKAAKP